MKYAIVTFGCRVNQADSLQIEEQLRAAGAEASSADRADLVVVNTCSVTATADQSARQVIRRIARQNPSTRIIATGCYATRRPEEVAHLPGVVRVVANGSKEQLVAGAPRELALQTTAGRFGDGEGACGGQLEPGFAGRTALTLRIQTGCDEPCSYCVIPSTRGSGRSLPAGNVLDAVQRATDAGYKEVVITGVHLGSYGRDLDPPAALSALLEELDRRAGDVRFRLSSLEPMDCSAPLVDLVAESPRFAAHFHLPLQHASDRMLRAMQRPYAFEDYRRLVDRIRRRLPNAAIGSDVIVGFPGETDDDFRHNAEYLRSSPLTALHVFPYSDRPGTVAAALPEKVPGDVIRARSLELRSIAGELTGRFRSRQVGSVHRALTLEDGTLALTGNYLKVRIAPGRTRNTWVDVMIREAASGELRGEWLATPA
ncbi:MAG: tRNA (N(6)-L-threonylcarbamoyladenosine(37)-C(2))-methylthiotransferase MtaB [Acidobacteria bacterium]|nr:tRNA (N(6)-L-threonylcarbamoyladenosine(37)-C(2))-methylthiotransferase MtaB [Acidobacteriota bacterium]